MKRLSTIAMTAALAASMTLAGAGAASATTESGARCDEGHWPVSVQGKPATLKVGGHAGYYIWHDVYGWHLRTTTPSPEKHVFSGQIVSADDVRALRVYRNEATDRVSVSGHVISFSFTTYNGIDGIDFLVGCTESLTFLLKGEGRWWPASRIWLGYRGTAPSNPFTVYRA